MFAFSQGSCGCGLSGSCTADSTVLCRCDSSAALPASDFGFILDKSDMPILNVRTTATDGSQYIVGSLDCAEKQFGTLRLSLGKRIKTYVKLSLLSFIICTWPVHVLSLELNRYNYCIGALDFLMKSNTIHPTYNALMITCEENDQTCAILFFRHRT